MFSRIRLAFGLALLLAVIVSITASAKGNFTFIEITSPTLKEAVRLTDPALTTDFFDFADFSQSRTEALADPGLGYEIARYYVDQNREFAFDHLHYYPDAGLVYYDGIVGGSSEYDGRWYTAKPGLKTTFETALANQLRLSASTPEIVKATPETVKEAVPTTVAATIPVNIPVQSQPATPSIGTQTILLIVSVSGLIAILGFAFLRSRRLAHR